MADRKSDFEVRPEAAKLLKDIKILVDKYKKLDDMDYVLNTEQVEINRLLKKFHSSLRSLILRFFTGSPLRKAMRAEQADLRAIGVTGKINTKSITRTIQSQLNSQINSLLNEMMRRYKAKIGQFNLLQEGREIDELWKFVNKRLGSFDTITYRNGAKVGIDKYIKMKSATAVTEARRILTVAEASKKGIIFGRVSFHGSPDSCKVHEGEVVFMNSAAREKYYEMGGKGEFKTVQELEDDETHIFLPNCKHKITALPNSFAESLIKFPEKSEEEFTKELLGS